ncbi:transposase [Streptomyces collinus]
MWDIGSRIPTGKTALTSRDASARGRALVDRELYLPKSWTEDRELCRTARVPDEREFTTKGELARHMVLSRPMASCGQPRWMSQDCAIAGSGSGAFSKLNVRFSASRCRCTASTLGMPGCPQVAVRSNRT